MRFSFASSPVFEITAGVDGMMCGMCEAHINEAVRAAFPVKKVSSSHAKGETVILSEGPVSDDKIIGAIEATGYDKKTQ